MKSDVCDNLVDLRKRFTRRDVRRNWVIAVDCGGLFLRYVGEGDDEPERPFDLKLPCQPFALLAQALTMAGIPAERV